MNSLFALERYGSTSPGHDDYAPGSVDCYHNWIITLTLDNQPIRRCQRCFREQQLHPERDAREIYQNLIKPFEKRLATYQGQIERASAPSVAKPDREAIKELKPVVNSLYRYINVNPERPGTLLFARVHQATREPPTEFSSVGCGCVNRYPKVKNGKTYFSWRYTYTDAGRSRHIHLKSEKVASVKNWVEQG